MAVKSNTARPAKPRARQPWQTPRLRMFPAREAEMPVGKINPGSDFSNQS